MIYPNVHILILNWNGKDYLYDCVKSVLNSNYQNFKVTVIDNGSSDNSIDLVRNNLDHVDFIYIDDNWTRYFAENLMLINNFFILG